MKVAVLGYGNIGNGVVQIIDMKKDMLAKEAGEPVEVKYVLDLREFPGDPYESLLVHDVNVIMNDPEISLVVETMGGTGAAYTFVKMALEAGKSAVTSNKALVAKYGSELLAIAREKNINFQFEASVGGAIPIIRPLYSCMNGTSVSEITGIMNGTTNFMLTKMATEGRTYEDVLKEAQDLGYAERDPSADVEGYDTCRKIAILASIAFEKFVDFENIPTTGITAITKQDMDMAKALGMSIKLLGSAKKVENGVVAEVAPKVLGPAHPLYAVNDVFNAIMVRGDMSGDLMFYGSGAGKLPTASAVVADVVECAKNQNTTVYQGWSAESQTVVSTAELKQKFFVRFESGDAGEIAAAFNAEKMAKNGGIAVITSAMTKAECEKLAAAFGAKVILAVAE